MWVFDAGTAEGRDRCGELVVEGAHGIAHTFNIRVTHQYTIPGDTYTLLSDSLSHRFWAVGRRLPDQRFEKVSVIAMDRREVIGCKISVWWQDLAMYLSDLTTCGEKSSRS